MSQLSFWEPAGENERFDPHAWDSQIGNQVPFRPGPGSCTLIAAEVAGDGSGVTLTIEIPDDFPPDKAIPMSGMSFAFREAKPEPWATVPLEVVRPRIRWK